MDEGLQFAVIEHNICTNIVVGDSIASLQSLLPHATIVELETGVKIGDTYENGVWKHSEEVEPIEETTLRLSSIAFVTLAEKGLIDETTSVENMDFFAIWEYSINYKVGDMRTYNGMLYTCIQAHTSQEDWTPDTASSLWRPCANPNEEYSQWSQPIGAHDAYMADDKVTHNEKHYISLLDNNVWEPEVYGWEEIE